MSAHKERVAAKVRQLHETSKEHLANVHAHRVHIAVGTLLAVVFICAIAAVVWFYHDRALPGVTVAGVDASGKTAADLTKAIDAKTADMRVTFSYKQRQVTAKVGDVGVRVDNKQTLKNTLDAKRGSDMLKTPALWDTIRLPLVTSLNIGTFKDYIVRQFPDVVVDAKDAQLVYSDALKEFTVQPSVPGQGFDVKTFETLLAELALRPRTATLEVSGTPVEPLIKDATVAKVQQEVNQRLKLSLKFLYQGKTMYTADPPDIAKWVNFTPDPASGTVSIHYDKAKIKQFLEKQVSPAVAAPPIDQKIVKNQGGGKEIILQAGRNGRTLQDADGLVNAIEAALTGNTSLEKEVTVQEAPYKTTVLTSYDHWVEVDLSEQRTTLYTGSTAVRSFTISSGVAAWPTVTGTFSVWYKTASQTMTGGSRASGDYYYLPNTTWVTYFHGDYSFHTAYWHNNFGQPMSHGCINMRAADAKALYDFAPLGTKVVVHY